VAEPQPAIVTRHTAVRERPELRRFFLACGAAALLTGSLALYLAPPHQAVVTVWLQTTLMPASILALVALNQRGNGPLLALTVGLLWAEALLTAALYTIGVSFAIVIPLIGIGIVQPYLRGAATLTVYVGAAVVATLSVALFALGTPPNPLSEPALAVMAFAFLAAFALGLVWRAGDRWVTALDAADREIAARVAAEQERERLEVSLRQAHRMEAVGRLAGVVAHDLNNALMAVGGYADFIRSDSRDPETIANAQKIIDAAEEATRMTKQLLVFAGQSIMRPEVIDVVAFVSGLERDLATVVGSDVGLEVRHEIVSGMVRVDTERLAEALSALAQRAREAMPDGGNLTISTSRVTKGGGDGPVVVVAVADTGAPIQPDVAERLFDPFLTTGLDPRTGLELAMAFGVVRQSGGEIEVRPGTADGSTIEIRLPEAVASGEPGEDTPT
jgi:signal transduction histidine kinase